MKTMMLLSRIPRLFIIKEISKVHTNKISIVKYSTATPEPSDIAHLKYEFEMSNVEPRIQRRKPPINPFMKDLFIGAFNNELLAYPEILNKQEFENLKGLTDSIQEFIKNEKYTSADITTFLKSSRFYGAPATVFHGGLEANLTERCKILESLGCNVEVAEKLKNHWMGIDCIKFGLQRDELDRIMPDIVKGKYAVHVVAEERIVTNPSMPEQTCLASLQVNGEWVINGEKEFIGAECRDGYFVVFCIADKNYVESFLVHPGANGIRFEYPFVKFNDTPAILLGRTTSQTDEKELMKTSNIIKDAIAFDRIGKASICIGLLRSAIESVLLYTNNKYLSGHPYSDLQIFQDSIAQAVASLYAIESMVYFTTGLNDGYEKPDTEVEMAICKVYATEKTFHAINGMFAAIGTKHASAELVQYLETARYLLMHGEENLKTNFYIAMNGLQHSGKCFVEDVKKHRNPFTFPAYNFKTLIKDRFHLRDKPKLDLMLGDFLHPSLQATSLLLEYTVKRLEFSSKVLLRRYGIKVHEEQRLMERLATVAGDVYASTASISRSSRAYCIGLYMAYNEMMCAGFIASLAEENVKKLVIEIEDDHVLNRDHMRVNIALKALHHRKSHYEHALERVFF